MSFVSESNRYSVPSSEELFTYVVDKLRVTAIDVEVDQEEERKLYDAKF